MDQEGFYVNIGFNKLYFTRALVDNGCGCYMSVSQRFANQAGLPRIDITPRDLHQVDTVTKKAITQVAYTDIDLDGHEQKRVFCYIIPQQEEDVILGMPWMTDQDVILRPRKRLLTIRKTRIRVRQRSRHDSETATIRQTGTHAFQALIRRERKSKRHEVNIFAATLADINKALQSKVRTDPRKKLPPHYHEFLPAFDRQQADQLPPHRAGVDHSITVEKDSSGRDRDLPWGPLYSMSREELVVLRKTLTELLDKNFIRASNSSASAPVLFVKKPGGGLRFCVDYRGLNAITKKDRYPLPLITETLRSLSKAQWFTKVDVIAAFNKIRIKEGDEWKTAFRTRYGLYEWLVTPFGMTGAPATFQRYINWTLRDYLDEFCTAYIDDVLIYTDGSLEDHRKQVRKVLQRLQDAGLQLDIDKSEFEVKSVKYLGYIVEAGVGIKVDPEKVEAIRAWEVPKTVKGVRSFLGFANYYREFIPGFSKVAMPLTALTRKESTFHWSDQCQDAFIALRELLTEAPVLAHWDPDKETIVETDSSGYTIGGVLSQYDQKGQLRPVAFLSKKNIPAEVNYPIHDKELLAVVRCLEQWDAELRSTKKFTVLTDHKNLEYFTVKRNLTERQMRWALTLSRFNFDMIYRPGKQNGKADALTRREQDTPQNMEDERLADRQRQLLSESPSGVMALHDDWKDFLGSLDVLDSLDGLEPSKKTKKTGKTHVRAGWVIGGDADQEYDEVPDKESPPENPFLEPELRELWERSLQANNRYWLIRRAVMEGERQFPAKWGLPISISECSIDEGRRLCWRDRIWIPHHEPLRTKIIQNTHDSSLTGHPGRDLTKVLIGRSFTWPGLSQDVRQFLKNCDVCGRTAVWREKRKGLLKPLPIPDRMWSELSVDFVTGVPPSGPTSATNIMVITDRLFKNVIYEPMASITTESVAEAMLTCLIRHHGPPRSIVSDRGPQFVGMVWKRICELLKIQRRLSTAFHPETDGSTERANQVMEQYLRSFVCYAQDDWFGLLPIAMLAVNNRTATSTGLSPFFATHGYNINPIDIDEPLRESDESPIARGERFVARLQQASDFAQAAIASAQEVQEHQANKSRMTAEQFRVGDKVWLNLKNVKTDRPSRKLDWLNAKYTVTQLIGSHSCRLDTPPGIHNVFHVMLLRRAADDPLPSQVNDDTQPAGIVMDDGNEEWEVEKILKTRPRGRGFQALIKWKGYSKPTWEPLRNFQDTAALDAYEAATDQIPHRQDKTRTDTSGRRGVL